MEAKGDGAIFILKLIDFPVVHLCLANMIIMLIVLVMEISCGLRGLNSTSHEVRGQTDGMILTRRRNTHTLGDSDTVIVILTLLLMLYILTYI